MRVTHPAQEQRPRLPHDCTAPTTMVWGSDGGPFRCDHAQRGTLSRARLRHENFRWILWTGGFGSTRLAFCHMSWTVAEAGASSAMLLVYHNVFHVGWFCPAPRSPLDLPPLGLFSDRSGSHPHLTRLALPIEPAILSLLFPFVPRRGSRLLSPIDPRRARVRMRHPRGGLHPLWEAPHRRTSHFFIVFGFFGA